MTRPLKYDDQFKSIINEKINDKFLFFFNLKVQSTGFCKTLNLQRSLIISSIYDIFIGVLNLFLFFHTVGKHRSDYIYLIEIFIQMLAILFGCLGIDCSTSLKKQNMRIYKIYRVILTFSFLIFELFWGYPILSEICSNSFCKLILLIIIVLINLYFTRLAWSFYIRLVKGHELLIIHGKYLENMMIEEEKKEAHSFINNEQQQQGNYVPPQAIPSTEMNIINFTNN